MNGSETEAIEQAARAVAAADAVLVAAGAGMGVDSGLPDFRGRQGFWAAYPPFARLGLDFQQLANPRWFVTDPHLAWGFYGHRLHLYRRTSPHEGFAVLKRWVNRAPAGGFVFTSNVDGQFQRAGFDDDQIYEVHGSIHWMQCRPGCGGGLFSADPWEVEVDPETMRAADPLPSCPRCGHLARPNILMFGDGGWDEQRAAGQEVGLDFWVARLGRRSLVVVECGAGEGVPTVRRFSERWLRRGNTRLIRINPRDTQAPPGALVLPMSARDALLAIDERLGQG